MTNPGWVLVKRYALVGWRRSSVKVDLLLVSLALALSALASSPFSPPFWVALSSLVPVILVYFPVLGLVMELLDRDWADWHLW